MKQTRPTLLAAALIIVTMSMVLGSAQLAAAATLPPPKPRPSGSPAPAAPDPANQFTASGYAINTGAPDFYGRWGIDSVKTVVPLDNSNPNTLVDANGALIVRWPGYSQPIYHPVAFASYAINALHAYDLTNNPEYLRRAVGTANALRAGGVTINGALWLQYTIAYAPHGDPRLTMPRPWVSGMAQGQALSVFTRLYAHTGDPAWKTAADQIFLSFTTTPVGKGAPWFVNIDQKHLWFEEYPGDFAPLHVINGHIYALLGLADYYKIGADPEARHQFDAGATTIRTTFSSWRVPGKISYYCAGQYCKNTSWQPPSYHRGVSAQLVSLSQLTGDPTFQADANLLDKDYKASGATG